MRARTRQINVWRVVLDRSPRMQGMEKFIGECIHQTKQITSLDDCYSAWQHGIAVSIQNPTATTNNLKCMNKAGLKTRSKSVKEGTKTKNE